MKVEEMCSGGATARVFSSIQPSACAAMVAGSDLRGLKSVILSSIQHEDTKSTKNRAGALGAPYSLLRVLCAFVLKVDPRVRCRDFQSSPCSGPSASALPDSTSPT